MINNTGFKLGIRACEVFFQDLARICNDRALKLRAMHGKEYLGLQEKAELASIIKLIRFHGGPQMIEIVNAMEKKL